MPKNQSKRTQVQGYKASFSIAVSALMQPDNREGTRILNAFQRLAKQLNIRNFDPLEVLSEATYRGIESIERKQEPIQSATAWLRAIGARVIKDQVRAEIRARKLIEKHSYKTEASDTWLKLMFAEEGMAAYEALQLLSSDDRCILRLRFIEEMSYKDIQTRYLKTKCVSVKVPTLRKRESRAVARLKTKFKEIYEQGVN